MSADPFDATVFEPATLHKYLYANADPLNKVDPAGLEFSLNTSLAAISGSVTVALSNFGARLSNAFSQGGPVLGEFFQSIGRFAQGRGMDVVQAFQRVNPQLLIEEGKAAGPRVIDMFVRFGQRAAYIEVKWGLPWRAGESMTRLVGQVNAAIAAGEGQVVVWAMRLPTPQQVNLVVRELGANASRVQFVYGIDAWIEWTRRFVGM